MPGSYFLLEPGKTKNIDVILYMIPDTHGIFKMYCESVKKTCSDLLFLYFMLSANSHKMRKI